MSESPPPHYRAFQENHPRSQSSVRAQQRAVDAEHQIAKGVVWSHRIVQRRERTHRASMRPECGRIHPDFSTLIRAPDYMAETFPHNRLSARARREVNQLAYWSV